MLNHLHRPEYFYLHVYTFWMICLVSFHCLLLQSSAVSSIGLLNKKNFQKMLSALQVIMTVILIVTWPCGTILNSSIIVVYLSNWKKGVKLGECDWISLSMGCNNLLLQCFITFGEAFITYGSYLPYTFKIAIAVGTVLWFSVCLSFWLTASLSVCYCFRLVNPLPKFIIQLKRRLCHTVTRLLLWSVSISFIIIVPMIWRTAIETNQNTTHMYHYDISNVDFVLFNLNCVCGVCLPSLVTSICILLSLISLLRHIRRMKQNTQFQSPQLENLIKACRTMFLLMALNFLFFLVILTGPYNAGTIWQTVIFVCIITHPSVEAIVLIFGNSKVLSVWLKTFIFK